MSMPMDEHMLPGRRRLLQAIAATAIASAFGSGCAGAASPACTPWAEWKSFLARHIQEDGRVVDFATPDQRSTSEGQSYALFFALVANDPVLFDKLLGWARHQLAGGRPDRSLPAWLWGRAEDGSWRVLDENSASDADLWIAYCLIEAGRLWNRPGYLRSGLQMLALVRAQEMVELPGFGPMLLPGRQGFAGKNRWTLNPSYLPLPLLRRFATVDPQGNWTQLADRTAAMIHDSAPLGFAPDWIAWDGKRFLPDPARGNVGSYDAIRVYLWAGMTHARDPLRKRLLDDLSGPLQLLNAQGSFAEKVDTQRGVGTGAAPTGFAGALLPYLDALGENALAKAQAQLIPAARSAAAEKLPYYERTLVLFGKGWHEGRYRFTADGQLVPAWRSLCSARN
ncbi:cellulose synthase complex periplasmic endoglucanase BcsZ [Stenotrophomonas sp. MMGLT7]|uniref:cellulose synthase complex periplasmic endoglucanase BcsZ n=1 Tax=Stenotrophomonas sp. MMGLT7 TaxID=2901227 RepID=UPI001E5D5ABA|nr:cellulose synthase complex periplasmic endoglucanase BcsZ [Stenotrophomonas sp. MMGLT7]MCD7099991.1 cellulase [Stenotrophomonas sp. MMGLT7]